MTAHETNAERAPEGEVTAAVSGALPTERVRELYGAAVRWDSDERFASIRDSNLAEFDAWLAQHDAEVRTAALAAVLPLAQSEAWKQGALTADPNLDPSAADEYNPYGEKESES